MLDVDRTLRLKKSNYFQEEQEKDLIVLHHTEGASARSTFDHFNRAENTSRTATAFIVERDGTIYEIFDPKEWALHIGIRDGDKKIIREHERRSIGIEIACEGVLTLVDGKYRAFVSKDAPKGSAFKGTAYDHGSPWRESRYFAAYTPEQLASVNALVDELCTRFDIARQTPKDALEFSKNHYGFRGVIGHNHVRTDKHDLHPGFDWPTLKARCGLADV